MRRDATLLIFTLLLGGCASGPDERRIDNIPMYGQPAVPRPDFARRADDAFIASATLLFKNREQASVASANAGDKYMNTGELSLAMRRYNQSWLLDPNNYRPYWGFGRIMLQRSGYSEAIEYFEKAVSLCADNFQKVALLSDTGVGYYARANTLTQDQLAARSELFRKANESFAESVRLEPTYSNAWYKWSKSLFYEGNYAAAWEKLRAARSHGADIAPDFIAELSQKMPEPR